MHNFRTLIAGFALAISTVAICGSSTFAAEPADHGSAHGASAESESPNPLVFDPDLAIFSAIVFLILVFVLGKFAWPQIATALDERERKIADNIAAAEARHEDAKRMLGEYEAKLAAASGEVRELLEEARRDAEATKARIAAEARQASEEEKARALTEIQRARDGAVEQLARASADTAIDLARRVVGEDLKAERQSQIVREALGMLSSASGANKN